jgi:glycosyltransferase involved in cell wall biosynthesis
VKWTTLSDRFAIAPQSVHCIRHAPVDLSRLIHITDVTDPEFATRSYCETLLANALGKSEKLNFLPLSATTKFKYLFYASQLRPSKNILTLLRAYKHLLCERLLPHKLILTCRGAGTELDEFVTSNNLGADVLFLPRLSEPELAACYKLADLAVNPSLFEGGMPFTFAEALSVSTPVVMSDIEVTREVLTEQRIRELTLFDPYSWNAMADKIEWALNNRESLLKEQREYYVTNIAVRTWDDVVSDHIAVLDRLVETKTFD